MTESFALKGATRYLRERHADKELQEVITICERLAVDLSKSKGYLHPRALAAASSHIYLTQEGRAITLESTSATFGISSATLREYLRAHPAAKAPDTAKTILERTLFGVDLREALKMSEVLNKELERKKTTLNPAALAAAAAYITLYKAGRAVSMGDIANQYGISTSTLRDYVSAHEEGVDPVERAKTLLAQYATDVDMRRLQEITEKVGRTLEISTARILAAIAYYLYTIDAQQYVTVEKVARDFNVSIPALRSYLEPYFPSISNTYLLFKKGDAKDIKRALTLLTPPETELLNKVYASFGTNIFELSLLFSIGSVPRGRWQLFVRKIGKLGLMDIYKKPLDPKQYCALVPDIANFLKKPESLQRWV
jgi:AraC-like DNA-binding protein